MAVSRRLTIISLGSLTAGLGLISGVGAFDSVSADRDVTVGFADDESAVLGMQPVEGDSRPFVTVAADDTGTIGISIDRLNRNARTVLDDLVAFTNNGTQPLDSIAISLTDTSTNGALSVHDTLDGVSLGVGETVVGLGLTVDTLGANGHTGEPAISGTITISVTT